MIGQIARSRVAVGVTCAVLGASVVGGIAWAAIPGSGSGTITACYPTSGATKGQLRVIDYQSGARCGSGEQVLTWQSRGMRFMGPWASTTSYGRDDVVTLSGGVYVAVTANLNRRPPTSAWRQLADTIETIDQLEGRPCNTASSAIGKLDVVYTPVGGLTLRCPPDASRTLSVQIGGAGGSYASVTGDGINCPTTCTASHPIGTTVTLTPITTTASTFSGWAGACTGTGTCSVTLDSNTSVTANFDFIPTQTLTVTPFIELPSGQFFDQVWQPLIASPTVSGRVLSDPPGIDCRMQHPGSVPPGTCSAQFSTFSDVTLRFEPNNASTVMLSLCNQAFEVSCSMHMDRPRETFAFPQVNFLTIRGSGECSATGVLVTVTTPTGTFEPDNCDRDGFESPGFYVMPAGTQVTVRYTSVDQYEWGGAGDLCSPTTLNPCSFTLAVPASLDLRRVL